MNSRIVVALVLVTIWLAAPGPATATPVRVLFAPSATDPAITQFNNSHYAVVDPAVASRGRLVVMLPGTGATPAMYRDFPDNAASLGFHALGLMYPNGEAINALCATNAPLDPDAAGNARLEVIDGSDRVGFVTVDRTNCIENRLIKALQYLHTTYPTRGWGQYLSGDMPRWDKFIVCGHSQGGGMAGMIAKTRFVDRCVTLASMDWWDAGNRPYNWMLADPQTPLSRWFLFAHERDQFLSFTNMRVAASALGVDRYGACVQVEASPSSNYFGRHFLSTDLEPSTNAPGSYHGCPVVDLATPLQADGATPVFKPAWDYLLLCDSIPPPTVIASLTMTNGMVSLGVTNLMPTATNSVLTCREILRPAWSTSATFVATSGQTNWVGGYSNTWDNVFFKIEAQ